MNKLHYSIFKKHILVSIYILTVLLLTYGAYIVSGFKHLDKILLHGVSLLVFYFALYFFIRKNSLSISFKRIKIATSERSKETTVKLICWISFIFMVVHYFIIGGVPVIKALSLDSVLEIANIRRSITANSPLWINYVSSLILKGVLPFTLLFFIIKPNKFYFTLTFLIGSFYCFSLMQKSYILILLTPSLIYVLWQKKVFYLLIIIITIISIIFSLVYISNPTSEKSKVNKNIKDTEETKLEFINVLNGLQKRILIVPGKTVVDWFEIIPEKKPFLYGDGYNFLAKIRGREYIDYSVDFYPILYPDFIKNGYKKGAVNTATFVYDYANFGLAGIIGGSFFLAIFFVTLEVLFLKDLSLKLSFNIFPILFLSSSGVTTLLFSGGWGCLILLYFIFLKDRNS